MTYNRLRTGRLAEARAAEHLLLLGYDMVERNARTRFGEIDIVALDRRALVFVEVKAVRAGGQFGPDRPVLWVTPRKQSRVRRLAAAWMAERRADDSVPRYAQIRFDAVGILAGPDDEVLDLEHITGAF
ncbi:MAG TPA: YraN family protein [Solirubrobacterales bacterium]|nr:YraN family protein [Solirubrobacterales bacterium]